MWFIYILKCKDDSLYVGRTSNLKRRIAQHNYGNGGFYTKNKRPVKLIYLEKFDDENSAFKREFQIKGWRREKKENLIKYGQPE